MAVGAGGGGVETTGVSGLADSGRTGLAVVIPPVLTWSSGEPLSGVFTTQWRGGIVNFRDTRGGNSLPFFFDQDFFLSDFHTGEEQVKLTEARVPAFVPSAKST